MRKTKPVLPILNLIVVLTISSCAHQSKIQLSNGHIDGNNTSSAQSISKSDVIKTSATVAIPTPVTINNYLPPPKPKNKEPLYSIVVYDTPVKEVLFAIARDSKLNVDIHPSIHGRVTLNAVDQTLTAILERLSNQVDLTYKVQGNVLSITPDQPVLRTYKVDYVNMSRDTKGFIGAAAEISSTGQGAVGGSTGGTGGGSANNSSRTSVTSESKNHLMETLIQNIKDLLFEADKEVIVARYGTSEQAQSQSNVANTNSADNAESNTASKSTSTGATTGASATERDQQRMEFKTLFAANVIANPETGVISVRATNKQHEKVQEFLDKVLNTAKRQVLIEVTIAEVILSDSFQAGIDWSRLSNNGSGFQFQQSLGPKSTFSATTGVGNTTSKGSTSKNPLTALDAAAGFAVGYFNPVSTLGNIASSITLLNQFGDTKVLSSPKLMVINNQTAVLKVVKNLVYFTVKSEIIQSSSADSTALRNVRSYTTTPNTVPVGVVLTVTPQINDQDQININIRPTISRQNGFATDPNPDLGGTGNDIPVIEVREMESLLQIPSGSTAVLGGLMQDEIFKNTDKVPGLSNIPGAGKIFTGRNDASRKTELVIFLRPTVIKNASLESDELASYKQYLPSRQLNNTLNTDN